MNQGWGIPLVFTEFNKKHVLILILVKIRTCFLLFLRLFAQPHLHYFRKIYFYSLPRYSKRSLRFFRQEKNRLLTVARVLSALLPADNTRKFETLGSNFRHEIRSSEAAAVHCYSIRSLILNVLSYSSVKKRIDFLQ